MSTNTPLTSAPIKRDERGRFLEKPPNLPVLTSATARAASQKRWDNYRRKAARGITREAQAIDPSIETPSDAYGFLVGKQYLALLDSDKPKFDDVYKLGQVIGALPTPHDKVDNSPADTIDAITGLLREVVSFAARVTTQPVDIIDIISNDDDSTSTASTAQDSAGDGKSDDG